MNYSLHASLAAALLGVVGFFSLGSQPQSDGIVNVTLHVGWQDLFELPRLYVAHTIDSSIIVKSEWWVSKEFEDPKVIRAMIFIAPGFIRFGGIMSDHMVFEEERPAEFRYEAQYATVLRPQFLSR